MRIGAEFQGLKPKGVKDFQKLLCGAVYREDTDEPVPNCAVRAFFRFTDGTCIELRTATDFQGLFSLKCPPYTAPEKLCFSADGYETKSVANLSGIASHFEPRLIVRLKPAGGS